LARVDGGDAQVQSGDLDAAVRDGSLDAALRDGSVDPASTQLDGSQVAEAGAFGATFPGRVRAALVGGAAVNNCVVFPPPTDVATREDARFAIMNHLALTLNVTNRLVEQAQVHECGAVDRATCSNTFVHDVTAGGGDYGTRLSPFAAELQSCVSLGEMTSWSLTLSSLAIIRATCLAGSLSGTLTGLCVLNGLAQCP
jgi:hypothetical protein